MVQNLNVGSMNNSLAGIAEHAGSMAGGTTIYFRNRTSDTPISFIPPVDKARIFEWFSTTKTATTFVKKPPSPIVLPGTTSSAIFYNTASSPPSVNMIYLYFNRDLYRLEWQFDGFRRLLFNDNVVVQTDSGDDCITAKLANSLFFRGLPAMTSGLLT